MTELGDITFDASEIEAIRSRLALPEPVDGAEGIEQPAPRKRRGRPPGSKNRNSEELVETTNVIPPATLTKRDEREVAERLGNILLGGTGMLGIAKPYLPMTEDEAKAIAVPLASYLVRNAETLPIAKQVLENYDLAAITLGVAAYSVRVYSERRNEMESQRSRNSTTLERIAESQVNDNGRGPNEDDGSRLSRSYYESSQPDTPRL